MFLLILLSIASAAALVYSYFAYKYTYWQRLGVPHPKPIFPFGNLDIGDRQNNNRIRELYMQYKDSGFPFFGIYLLQQPAAIASSLEMVKNVMIKDFQYFTDRGIFSNAEADPLSAHLFTLDGERWSKMRHKLSPTFTSGKMKFMYPTIVDVAKRFEKCLARIVIQENFQVVEVKELLARFTTDVIGTCAFGIECNSLDDPNAIFRLKGRKAFDEPRHGNVVVNLIRAFPSIAQRLGVKVFADDVIDFFMKVVRDTVAYREENDISRNDFMDMLIKMKNHSEDPLTIEEIAAQAFIFFSAGFETSSTTMMFALYELALNPDIQTKAREEIKKVLSKHGGQFTYEAMMDLQYVDQVLNGRVYMLTSGNNYLTRHLILQKHFGNILQSPCLFVFRQRTIPFPVQIPFCLAAPRYSFQLTHFIMTRSTIRSPRYSGLNDLQPRLRWLEIMWPSWRLAMDRGTALAPDSV